MTEFALRPYQAAAIQKLREKYLQKPVLVSPTGSGKTVMAAEIISGAVKKGKRVLFLAHRKELVDQCSGKISHIPHGIIMAGRPKTEALVQIASIQTLIRRDAPKADLIIIDECHHASAKSYRTIVSMFPSACLIGLTATPFRSDGQGLGHLFQSFVIAASLPELIQLEFIVPCRYFAPSRVDMRGVKKLAGDYSEAEAYARVSGLVGDVVKHYQKLAGDRLGICFGVTVAHSKELCARFLAAGISSEHLDADTPKPDRERIISAYKTGKTRVICNVGILSEGFDCPETGVIIMARPTASMGLFAQQIGRGLRPFAGKADCMVLDHAGNVERHGFLPDEFEVDLTHGLAKKKKPPSLKTCTKCYAVFPSKLQKCPECGHEKPLTRQEIREASGELEEIKTVKKLPNPREYYRAMAKIGAERGYKPGYAGAVFKSKFRRWPTYAERK